MVEGAKKLENNTQLPWQLTSDFNEILCEDEQLGGNRRPQQHMQAFRNAMDFCELRDLGYSGYPFTWCNRRDNQRNIQVRLDRCLADES